MERDLAHEADMAALRREQLRGDFGPGDCEDDDYDSDYNDYLKAKKELAARRVKFFSGRH